MLELLLGKAKVLREDGQNRKNAMRRNAKLGGTTSDFVLCLS